MSKGLTCPQASSIRYSGAPDDMYHDTANFYFTEHFNGGEEFVYGDTPQLNYDDQVEWGEIKKNKFSTVDLFKKGKTDECIYLFCL